MDLYGCKWKLYSGEEFTRVIDEVYSWMDSQLYCLYPNSKQEQLMLAWVRLALAL